MSTFCTKSKRLALLTALMMLLSILGSTVPAHATLSAVPAPAEDAPALFRRALSCRAPMPVNSSPGLLDRAFWICKDDASPRC